MSFFKTIKSSVYDPEFYSRIVSGENTHPFKYFFKLCLTISIIYTIIFSVFAVSGISTFLKEAGESILANYPKELEIKIENGVASTNVDEPYIIKIPEGVEEKDKVGFENILVIDTKSEFNLETFEGYKTLGLLTKDSLVTKDGRNQIKISPLREVPDYTINYASVERWLGKAKPFMKALPFIVPFMVFLGIFIAKSFLLVYLLLAALIVYVIGRVKKLDLSYKKSYHLSLHLVTLQVIFGGGLFLLGVTGVDFLPTLIFTLMAWFNLKKALPPVLV